MGVIAKNVRFGGSLQGGHGAASWEVPVDNAYLAPPRACRRGQWVVLYDDEHELWEGEVLSVKPAIDVGSGAHKFVVTAGGLLSVAAKRDDLSRTWVHRGGADWRIHEDANRSGEYTLGSSDGTLKMLIRKGAKEYYIPAMMAILYLDGALSGDVITKVDYVAEYNVLDEGSYGFAWSLLTGDVNYGASNASSAADSGSLTPTAGFETGWVSLSLWGYDSTATRNLTSDKYIALPTIDVYGAGQTAKLRVDQVMVDIATRPGLATSSVSEAIGLVLDDIHFAQTSYADMLTQAAALPSMPLDYGFWDDKTFRVKRIPRRPPKLTETVVVGGGMPGLTDWSVTPNDDLRPDYVCVTFKNKDNPSYPEGFVRCLYVPGTPPDTADVVVQKLDFSGLILSDAAAATAGAQLLGGATAPYVLPAGAVWSIHPERADGGFDPGNNTDPTEDYAQTVPDWPTGTVTGCAFTTASGWAGSNMALDPTRLVLDGDGDYADFGDLAALDVGTGALSATAWVYLGALGLNQVILSKSDGTTGFLLWVSETNHVCAWVGQSGADIRAAHETSLEADTWHHVAFTWSGTAANTLTVYVDGIAGTQSGLVAASWTTGLTNAASLLVGS